MARSLGRYCPHVVPLGIVWGGSHLWLHMLWPWVWGFSTLQDRPLLNSSSTLLVGNEWRGAAVVRERIIGNLSQSKGTLLEAKHIDGMN
jgi:hypothetical protein